MTRNRSAEERARATVERIKAEKAAEQQRRLEDRLADLRRAATEASSAPGEV